MIILSVDPGIKNLGFAVIKDRKLARYGVFSLVENVNKKYHKNYTYLVKRFTNLKMFKDAHVIVIERQMNQKMRCIATALMAFAWPRGVLVSPRTVKIHHGISCGEYRKNKAAAIQRAPQYMSFRSRKTFSKLKHKKDDISDAVLMGMWFAETQGETEPVVFSSDEELNDDDIEIDIYDEEQEQHKEVVPPNNKELIEMNMDM